MNNHTLRYFISVVQDTKELSRKEKEILIDRLSPKTLDKIGRKHHLSGERIRQIEQEAVDKFKKKEIQLKLFNESTKRS